VLTALLPALDDIDRIREHSEMDESFKAVSAKIDKAFEKFGVEKFGGPLFFPDAGKPE
jgi:molecular chaperone GrpE